MANSLPPLKNPTIWWEAILARAEEKGRTPGQVVDEMAPLMNSFPGPVPLKEARRLSIAFPFSVDDILVAFRDRVEHYRNGGGHDGP